jgi:hypothetical protein
MAEQGFCIRNEYDNEAVLLTGGLGFCGSVVLEQLLRTTNVSRRDLAANPWHCLCLIQHSTMAFLTPVLTLQCAMSVRVQIKKGMGLNSS